MEWQVAGRFWAKICAMLDFLVQPHLPYLAFLLQRHVSLMLAAFFVVQIFHLPMNLLAKPENRYCDTSHLQCEWLQSAYCNWDWGLCGQTHLQKKEWDKKFKRCEAAVLAVQVCNNKESNRKFPSSQGRRVW
ncbi:uncharacterized protein LOC110669688 [Hevea brasiliensis]|uniref:uncharacterized protein LOC110669688 n=1 Tax=Hevea brasiliensis TaxID=3981 RepID=UPI0025CDF3E7|nr:uncharacterized protein LOC110669688 [Hevea brasiliensis]